MAALTLIFLYSDDQLLVDVHFSLPSYHYYYVEPDAAK